MKKLLILLCTFLLTGCDNSEEVQKNNYLAMKSSLEKQSEFNQSAELPCDITVIVDRINEELISYSIIFDNQHHFHII